MFDGWMAYGGQEIFNGPRTKAYLEHLQPSLAVGDACCDCDTLAAAMGESPYSTPAQDNAAWYNPYAPETGGFYGFIPLATEGFEDSTWQTPITDLMGDGSVAGRGRRGGRDLRFRMLAVAESEKAMSRGLAWLRDTLSAENCATGDCGGAQMCYLTDCPGCSGEDADCPEVVEVVDHVDYRGMTAAQVPTLATDWIGTVPPVAYTTPFHQTYAWWNASHVTVERPLSGFGVGDFAGEPLHLSLSRGSNFNEPRMVPRIQDFVSKCGNGCSRTKEARFFVFDHFRQSGVTDSDYCFSQSHCFETGVRQVINNRRQND
jgi:hypothetical protein